MLEDAPQRRRRAQAFVDLVLSADGQKVLSEAGLPAAVSRPVAASTRARPRRTTADRAGASWCPLGARVAVLFLVLPLVGLLVRAPWRTLADAAEPGRRRRGAAAVAGVRHRSPRRCALVLGVPLAWVLARGRVPGRRLLRALVTVPLVLPPVVGGVALLRRSAGAASSGSTLDAGSASRCRSPRRRWWWPRRSWPCRSWSSRSRARCGAPTAGTRRRPRPSAPPRWYDLPPGHAAADRPGRRWPARCCAGPGRWASSAPRSPSPATSRAAPRPCRSPSTSPCETDPDAAIALSPGAARRVGRRCLRRAAGPVAARRRGVTRLDAARRRSRRATAAAFGLDVALTSQPGEVVALLGPNGAGKTTALRALAGLAPLTRALRLDGTVVDDTSHGPARAGAAPGRRGVPGLPAVPAPDRAGERRLRAARPRRGPARGPRAGRRLAGPGRAWPSTPAASRASSPAARPSGWRSPGRWPPTRGCCCSTSRWPRWTPRTRLEVRAELRRHWPTFDGADRAGDARPAGRDGAGRPAGRRRGRPGRPVGAAGRGRPPIRAPTTSPGWSG